MARGMYIGVDNQARKVKQMYVGADRLLEGLTVRPTTTVNGITFTNNGDGTVSINGTATAETGIPIFADISTVQPYFTKGGKMKLEMKNATYNHTTCNVSAGYANNGNGGWVIADGSPVDVPAGSTLWNVEVWIQQGVTVSLNNLSFDLRWLSPTTIARRVKKAYIGIGGVARPFFGDYEIEYYGTITSLSALRSSLAGGEIGDYAVFHCGFGSNKYQASLDAYNKSLTRTTKKTNSSKGRINHKSANTSDYLIFMTGSCGSGEYNYGGAFDSSLTETYVFTVEGENQGTGFSIGGYAVFVGLNCQNPQRFDNSLTCTKLSTTIKSQGQASAKVGEHVLVTGAYNSSAGKAVDVFDASLTLSATTNIEQYKKYFEGGTVGDYAIFAGGAGSYGRSNEDVVTNTTDAYDKSLTKVTVPSLSVARCRLTAIEFANKVMFAGGKLEVDTAKPSNVVDIYDASLTRTLGEPLSVARGMLASAKVGNYALIAGGTESNGSSYTTCYDTVDAYKLV
jgi:hypothetical protein